MVRDFRDVPPRQGAWPDVLAATSPQPNRLSGRLRREAVTPRKAAKRNVLWYTFAAHVGARLPATEGRRTMAESSRPGYRFKLGMFLNELRLPLDEALTTAKEIGAEYVWFDRIDGERPIAEIGDTEIDFIVDNVTAHGLKLFLISAGAPFKTVHLADLDPEAFPEHPELRAHFDGLVRSMQIANRLGVPDVLAYTFAWPGEYTGDKPTWPMRWLTRGGVIANVDMDKLVKVFTLVLEQAERYDVNVVLSMMPWNYTNTTHNFRLLAERLGSSKIKVMWGPADNLNCGELDVASAGFVNVRPYLHSLHIKDLHMNDGLHLDFDYRPIGEGDVDFPTVLRNLRDSRSDAVLSVATHFTPPSGSRVDAMKTNFSNLRRLIGQVDER